MNVYTPPEYLFKSSWCEVRNNFQSSIFNFLGAAGVTGATQFLLTRYYIIFNQKLSPRFMSGF